MEKAAGCRDCGTETAIGSVAKQLAKSVAEKNAVLKERNAEAEVLKNKKAVNER